MNTIMERLYQIMALDKAIDSRDDYTRKHSRNVASLMGKLAYHMQLTTHMQKISIIAGLVHDVGKMGVVLPILNKPGRLTPEEYSLMQQHSGMGEEILMRVGNFGELLPVVRHHHERYDGTGYPDKVAGKDIPLLSRMLALCDTYDAMTTRRCYRSSTTAQNALLEIQRCSNSQFDPEICQFFLDMAGQRSRIMSA